MHSFNIHIVKNLHSHMCWDHVVQFYYYQIAHYLIPVFFEKATKFHFEDFGLSKKKIY